MAKANGKAADGLPEEFVEQLCEDFRAEVTAAGPELVAGLANSATGQSSVSVTVALNQRAATKKRSQFTEAMMTARVRAPREPHHYEVDFDGQGRLSFEGVLDAPREAPVSQ